MIRHDPAALVDARQQLHWAAQLLAASAEALIEHAADHSHGNLAWVAEDAALVARTNVALILSRLTLRAPDGGECVLEGTTLAAARAWLEERLGVELEQPEYELPAHPVAEGRAFRVESVAALERLAEWLDLGSAVMAEYGECRVWPHHFDLGWLDEVHGPALSVGGGLSLGDEGIAEPYFYVNPYGVPRPASLPVLAGGGEWTDTWFGAVLPASRLLAAGDPRRAATDFLRSAESAGRRLLCG